MIVSLCTDLRHHSLRVSPRPEARGPTVQSYAMIVGYADCGSAVGKELATKSVRVVRSHVRRINGD